MERQDTHNEYPSCSVLLRPLEPDDKAELSYSEEGNHHQ